MGLILQVPHTFLTVWNIFPFVLEDRSQTQYFHVLCCEFHDAFANTVLHIKALTFPEDAFIHFACLIVCLFVFIIITFLAQDTIE